jgi:hypothetical protein
VKRDVPQANVELVLSMQRPWRQDEKWDSRDAVRLEADEAALRAAGLPRAERVLLVRCVRCMSPDVALFGPSAMSDLGVNRRSNFNIAGRMTDSS